MVARWSFFVGVGSRKDAEVCCLRGVFALYVSRLLDESVVARFCVRGIGAGGLVFDVRFLSLVTRTLHIQLCVVVSDWSSDRPAALQMSSVEW